MVGAAYRQPESVSLECAFTGRARAFPQGKRPMTVEFREWISALRTSVAKGRDDAQKNPAVELLPFSETIARGC